MTTAEIRDWHAHVYFDPGSVKRAVHIPPVPEVPDGTERLPSVADGDDHFDNFTFYLMLAAKLDLPTALRAADAFSTGSQVAYTRDGRTCFRAAMKGRTGPRTCGATSASTVRP